MKLNQNVIVDLDCLIDTRYGLLYQCWGGRVNAVDMQKYCERKTSRVWEHFGVLEEEWKAAYAKRSVETLLKSAPTLMSVYLQNILTPAIMQAMSSPIHNKPTLTVNYYPYRLEEWEVEDVKASVQEFVGKDVSVKCVYIPTYEFTPEMIKREFNGWILYDLLEWLTMHNEALAKTPMPDVTFFIPSVINVGDENSEEVNIQGEGSPFSVLKASLSEFVLIDAIDVKLYSIPHQPL